MFPRTVETAFARYQAKEEAAALAIVFDRTAPELLRLARHLAADATQAEDLVQATFLTAIESANSHEAGRPVLPWLCGILTNHARSERRQARRAPEPSRLRADNVQDVHAETCERELREEVHEAIAQLPEVYRPVLRLWLEHGLEAHEIAATLERPAGTVRAQVTRGMEQLRRALPAGLAGATAIAVGTGNGLAAVRSQVLGTCSGTSSGLVSTLALGGLMMLHHKVLAALAALLLGMLAWLAWPPTPTALATDKNGGHAAANVAEAAHEPPAPTTADAADATTREVVATDGATDQPAPTPNDITTLIVELRDAATGEPLRGYGVAARPPSAAQTFGNFANYIKSDADGNVQFDDPPTGQVWIEVDRTGLAAIAEVSAGKLTRQTVELKPAGLITGIVRDPNGNPVADASVHVLNNALQPPELVKTDLAGRYAISHASALTLLARHPTFAPSLAIPAKAMPGNTTELDLQLLSGGRSVRGIVYDDRGEPLGDCSVAVLPASARKVHPYDRDKPKRTAIWLHTDASGRFETSEAGREEYLVFAVPRDLDMIPTSGIVDTSLADGFLELRSPKAAVVTGLIKKDGVVPAGVQVIAFPEQPVDDVGYLLNLVGRRTTTLNEDGSFRMVGVLPGKLSVRATRGLQTIAETRFELAAGEEHHWQPSFGAQQELHLHVRTSGKQPRSLLALVYTGRDGAAPAVTPIGKDGTAAVKVHADGPVDITLSIMKVGGGLMPLARFRGVTITPEVVALDLRANQLPIGSIRGRLVDERNAPLAAQTVCVQRVDASGLFSEIQATTGADGTFAIGPVPAGDYHVKLGSLLQLTLLREVTVSAAGDEHLGDVHDKPR
tara:strand:+ start:13132 stop:15663 length:2532 start_codon:yes stop_codon:yes gene_type:complete